MIAKSGLVLKLCGKRFQVVFLLSENVYFTGYRGTIITLSFFGTGHP